MDGIGDQRVGGAARSGQATGVSSSRGAPCAPCHTATAWFRQTGRAHDFSSQCAPPSAASRTAVTAGWSGMTMSRGCVGPKKTVAGMPSATAR